MRHYEVDSPESVSRLLALTILADGGIDLAEMRLLQQSDLARQFGIEDAQFDRVMHEFCLDLMQSGKNQLELDRESIVQLLHDVRSPTLQRKLLRIMLDIVDADQSLVGSESILLAEAMMIWGVDMHHLSLNSTHPVSYCIPLYRRSPPSVQ
ncbi:TerB family tellurite resistance protein [Giesbergeria anulus]|uniref:Tellurite resistance protein TerB n=1 Tax=Giesbergeria anulus TaxID=180197 RepID=A0A1H9PQT6_9BURK|nr:TerB family tellurite resistance protein [Giesbergeria anulus]SER50554.1 Tellurite resistance protein TerB [Giesbergeria anulus]